MTIKDVFVVGEIMEWEDKDKKIPTLTGDDCKIVGKTLNKNKIILHMKRDGDASEGNIFVRIKDDNREHFPTSKKLLASKKVLGLTVNEFKNFNIDDL